MIWSQDQRKKNLKKITRQPWFVRFVSFCLGWYIYLVFKTNRWTFHNHEIFRNHWEKRQPIIVCFWHNRLLMSIYAWDTKYPFYMLSSAHRDGQFIAQTINRYGFKTIYGSSSKEGTKALREILSTLKQGHTIGITPDGPHGPRFKVSDGILQISKLSQIKIVPIAYATSRRKIWNSWDRFILALPFGRGVFVIGHPVDPPASKEEIESVRHKVEQELQRVTKEADHLCGHPPLN